MSGSRRRGRGDGTIDKSGEGTWRVRYRIGLDRFQKTVTGSKADARRELRKLLHAGDTGQHVAPDKMVLGDWIEHWIKIGCPGNRWRKKVGQRTLERYAELLTKHVLPSLGTRPLQQLQASEIDDLYVELGARLSPQTVHHVHSVLGACLGTAARTRRIVRNPMLELEKVPAAGEGDHGTALDAGQLRDLIKAFEGSALFPIVATAGRTGARRNELLALRCSDLDPNDKTLRIERAIEETKQHGLRVKGPKTERGKRTIAIDDDLVGLLLRERERLQRLKAGVPDGAKVDLSLVALPDDALLFPNPPAPGNDFSFTAPRKPRSVTKEFARKARALGFPRLRFHDLRGSHETALLDAGVPVHVVAARCGHDPAVLLRAYAKRTRQADADAATAIGDLLAGSK
jgi:integrase